MTKTILKKNNEGAGSLKICYKALVSSMMWCWCRIREMKQLEQMRETNNSMYMWELVQDKGSPLNQLGNDEPFNKSCQDIHLGKK